MPDLQVAPAHSGTSTLPALPALPRWMCAALAAPVSLLQVSFHVSLLPFRLAVNMPVPLEPLGAGTSALAVSFASAGVPAVDAAPAALASATQAIATAAN